MKEKEIVKTVDALYRKIDRIPTRKRVKQLEVWLKKNFATPYPVVVHVEKFGDDSYGECYKWSKNLTIRINKKTSRSDQVHSLIHEWAHAMSWPNRTLEKHKPDHSDEWGLAYAKVYRAWFDEWGFIESTGIKVDKIILEQMVSSERAKCL